MCYHTITHVDQKKEAKISNKNNSMHLTREKQINCEI